MSSLKQKATVGILWSAVDKFAVQTGHFVVGIVLARILMPTDFGLIGMLSIFIAISSAFVDSGMGSGLVQRQERTDKDFSTVFVFNFAVSSFFFLILFFSAPLISSFYEEPQLINLTRVLSINLIINSLAIVQRSKLTIQLDFKSFAKVNVIGIIVGGSSGILAATNGLGVWSLVIQTLLGSVANVVSLWYFSKWKPSLQFSQESFRALFGYGSNLLIAGLYAKTLQNVYNITIGKAYTASELGLYTRAKGFSEIASGTVTRILHQVTFPILASVQNDKDRLIYIYSSMIRMAAFVIFPVMTLIALLAEPIVLLLLTDKWEGIIPLLQWMVFARIFYPISAINMNILNAVGRSDLFLKVDLSKFPIIAIALAITIPFGVKAMIIGQVVTAFIAFGINAYLPGKYYGYGVIKQLQDIFPVILATGIMSIIVFYSTQIYPNLYFKLIFGGIIGLTCYIGISYVLKIKELNEFKLLINKMLKYN